MHYGLPRRTRCTASVYIFVHVRGRAERSRPAPMQVPGLEPYALPDSITCRMPPITRAHIRWQRSRPRTASPQSGRDCGALVLQMVIADETDAAAIAKWEHYKAGTDHAALALRDAQ